MARTVAPAQGEAKIEGMEQQRRVEVELLRRMSPAQKLAVMTSLLREAYRLKSAWVRHTNPELTEEEIQVWLREWMAGDRS